MGKYIPVQTNYEIQGDVLVKLRNKTVTGLILPEIVYNVKRKLVCIFIENHNSEPLDLYESFSPVMSGFGLFGCRIQFLCTVN